MNDFWIILTGVLVAVNCGLLGAFLILRKMSMVGDAISHAVLPGIVIAYLVADSRNGVVMLIGAAGFGLLTTFLIEWFYKRARIQADASIGITFTWLFAIGVILVSAFTGNVDLDQECVLYGDIAYVPFDLLFWNDQTFGPTPIWLQSGNLVLILATIFIGYRGLFITSFDPGFATGLGIRTGAWHYALMGAVSLTVVLSFNAVGAILVVAFLVVPPAAAYLISKKLPTLLWFTVLFGILSAVGGFYLAVWWQASISGSMAVAAGFLFLVVFILSKLINVRHKKRESIRFSESHIIAPTP
jgi:manganese/zinc/iron transport system permease protein